MVVDGVLGRELVSPFAMRFALLPLPAVSDHVLHIVATGAVSQVRGRVVETVSIEVPDLFSFGLGAMRKVGSKIVDEDIGFSSVDADPNTEIPAVSFFDEDVSFEDVSTLAAHTGDDLLGGGIELVPRGPGDGYEPIMVAVEGSRSAIHGLTLQGVA
jgi:hypothetical protein